MFSWVSQDADEQRKRAEFPKSEPPEDQRQSKADLQGAETSCPSYLSLNVIIQRSLMVRFQSLEFPLNNILHFPLQQSWHTWCSVMS
jgi:hypothetical protein